MATTPKLKFTYVEAAQSQKHVPVNENSVALDALIQCSILELYRVTPPVSSSDGDRYIVGASATGAWAGKDYKLAYRVDGVWRFFDPQKGWIVFNEADNRLYMLNSSFIWRAIAYDDSFIARFDRLGLGGATPDASNRFSINSPQALFNNAGAGINLYLNKSAANNDAAFTFQTGFSTRAIFGLLGDNNFSIRVTPDGSTWRNALHINNSTGFVGLNGPGADSVFLFSCYAANLSEWPMLLEGKQATHTFRNAFLFRRDVNGGAVTINTNLGGFSFGGYDGTTYTRGWNGGAELLVRVVENWTPSARGTEFVVRTTVPGQANTFDSTVLSGLSVRPAVDNNLMLGTSGFRWASVWAANGTIQTSDERNKLIENKGLPFAVDMIKEITPILFKWKIGGNELTSVKPFDGATPINASEANRADYVPMYIVPVEGKRLHAGFRAQDIGGFLAKHGIDFGVWGLANKDDVTSEQWVRPDQLIPIIWEAVKHLLNSGEK